MTTCPHSVKLKLAGLCPKCNEKKPYTQFRLCKDSCLNCNGCGWFFGPGAKEDQVGKPIVWNK